MISTFVSAVCGAVIGIALAKVVRRWEDRRWNTRRRLLLGTIRKEGK